MAEGRLRNWGSGTGESPKRRFHGEVAQGRGAEKPAEDAKSSDKRREGGAILIQLSTEAETK